MQAVASTVVGSSNAETAGCDAGAAAPSEVEVPVHVTLGDDVQRSRVMIVGDVHGCYDELQDLINGHSRPERSRLESAC